MNWQFFAHLSRVFTIGNVVCRKRREYQSNIALTSIRVNSYVLGWHQDCVDFALLLAKLKCNKLLHVKSDTINLP